jgi:adenosylcobinamide-GDP ribazoletransferase
VLLGPVVIPFVVMAAAGGLVVGWLARRRIGGQTGDVLGAAEQVIEVLLYVLTAGLVQAGVLDVWWWETS